MQTGHWLNLKRNNSATSQALSICFVCLVTVPILAILIIGRLIYLALHRK
jgi:hypothetical protein